MGIVYFDRGRSRSRYRHHSSNFRRNDRNSTRSRSSSRSSSNRGRIRCFKCKEYNHIAKDCPNVKVTEMVQTEKNTTNA